MRAIKRINYTRAALPAAPQLELYIINDLHFKAGFDGNGTDTGAVSNNRYYYASPNLVRSFVQKMNEKKPDVILVLGDICDNPADYPLFMDIWSGLDPTIKTAITIGNHDYDVLSYEQLVAAVGYDEQPEIAKSRFNQTFVVEDTRFIILDATFNADNVPGPHWQKVRISNEAVNWLDETLEAAAEGTILIGTHVAPHQAGGGYFEVEQANAIAVVLAKHTAKSITWLCGHHHQNSLHKYAPINGSDCYLCPAMINNEDGRYTEIILQVGDFEPKTIPLPYVDHTQ